MASNMFDVEVVNPLQALLLGQQSYKTGVDNNRQAAKDMAVREASQLASSGDRAGALAKLLGVGDYQGAGLMNTMDQQAYGRGRDTINDAWREKEAKRAQGNSDRSFYESQDYSPEELDARRVSQLKAAGVDLNSQEARNFRLSGNWEGAGANKNGLQPVYGIDEKGQPVIMQMNPSGVVTRSQMPPGVTVSKEPIKIDNGTHWSLMDPITRQIIGQQPKNVSAVEQEKVLGEETAKAKVALPQVLSTANQTLQSIEMVRKHPGRGWATGSFGTIPGIPGTEQRGFIAALDQLKGKTFLEAFNALRGGGAITEAEGAKATNAMARLDRAQNDKDFEQALNDLRDVVKGGMMRAAAKARGAGNQSQEPAASGGAGGVVDWQTYFGGQ